MSKFAWIKSTFLDKCSSNSNEEHVRRRRDYHHQFSTNTSPTTTITKTTITDMSGYDDTHDVNYTDSPIEEEKTPKPWDWTLVEMVVDDMMPSVEMLIHEINEMRARNTDDDGDDDDDDNGSPNAKMLIRRIKEARGAIIDENKGGHNDDKGKLALKFIIRDVDNPLHDYGQTIDIPIRTFLLHNPHSSSSSNENINNDQIVPADASCCTHQPQKQPPNDLIHLTHINEPTILQTVFLRYSHHGDTKYRDPHLQENANNYSNIDIYTSIGSDILLSVNPHRSVPELYDDVMLHQYFAPRGDKEEEKWIMTEQQEDEEPGPHVYKVGRDAYRKMMKESDASLGGDEAGNQTILISGESCSGKSATSQYLLKYFSSFSSWKREQPMKNIFGDPIRWGEDGNRTILWKKDASVEDKVLEVNTILQSFGNASTIRNLNSSRFGTHIQLQYSTTTTNNSAKRTLTGCNVKTFLLEVTRVTQQQKQPCNFHVFYELMDGLTDDERESHYFTEKFCEPSDFRMTAMCPINDEDRQKIGGRSRQTRFEALLSSMTTLGFKIEEQKGIFTILASLLHSSNFQLYHQEHLSDNSSADDGEDEIKVDGNNPNVKKFLSSFGYEYESNIEDIPALDKNDPNMKAFLSLMGFQYYEFFNAIRRTTNSDQNDENECTTLVPDDVAQRNLYSFIEWTYQGLFDFVVKRINDSLSIPAGSATVSSIGILDFFSFEQGTYDVESNSFYLLCRNYCSEIFQEQYHRSLFQSERHEYFREGIVCSNIQHSKSQVLDLIHNSGGNSLGLLQIFDQAMSTKDDKKLFQEIHTEWKDHPNFFSEKEESQKNNVEDFSIEHYAGVCTYNVNDFINCSSYHQPSKHIIKLLRSSSKTFLSQTLANTISQSVAPKDQSSLSSPVNRSSNIRTFTSQLHTLLEEINRTRFHFIRCIRPNLVQTPHFDRHEVQNQMQSLHLVETARMRPPVFYSKKLLHEEFARRYRTAVTSSLRDSDENMELTSKYNRFDDALSGDEGDKLKALCSELVKDIEIHLHGGIVEALNPIGGKNNNKNIQMGKSKVFMKQGTYEKLENLRTGLLTKSAIKIQSFNRGRSVRKLPLQQLSKDNTPITKSRQLFMLEKTKMEQSHLSPKIMEKRLINLTQATINEYKKKSDVMNKGQGGSEDLEKHLITAIEEAKKKSGVVNKRQGGSWPQGVHLMTIDEDERKTQASPPTTTTTDDDFDNLSRTELVMRLNVVQKQLAISRKDTESVIKLLINKEQEVSRLKKELEGSLDNESNPPTSCFVPNCSVLSGLTQSQTSLEQERTEQNFKNLGAKTELPSFDSTSLPPVVSNYYEVDIPITKHGLLLNMGQVQGKTIFTGYRQTPDGKKGPSELANLVHNRGDRVIGIDGENAVHFPFDKVIDMMKRSCKKHGIMSKKKFTRIRFQGTAYKPQTSSS